MFKVEQKTYTERYCPNGHEPLVAPLLGWDDPIKFCHICGALILERQATCDAAMCSECNRPVNPEWNFCPYCSQGREE